MRWLAHTWSQMSFPERLSPLLGRTQATGADNVLAAFLFASVISGFSTLAGKIVCAHLLSATERHLISILLPPVDWRQVDTRQDAKEPPTHKKCIIAS